jgi:peptidyl-prolyl cis-trans isomerase C
MLSGNHSSTETAPPSRIAAWLRSPLLYFFILGLIVFGLHSFLNSEAGEGRLKDPGLVEITSADIEWLRSNWNKKMGREPTPEEFRGLVDSFIREEILYREGVSMGLDQHDSVIRRRLAQKMEFLFKDIAEMSQPGEEELRSFFEDNSERYLVPALVSFTHVYFNLDNRGVTAGEEADELLARLKSGKTDPYEAPVLGDRFMLQSYYPQMAPRDVSREFGQAFSDGVFSLEGGGWHGPLRSGYGLHLVYIHDQVEARMPELEEVQEKVSLDLMSDRREKVNKAAYQEIKTRYTILVENMPYGASGAE